MTINNQSKVLNNPSNKKLYPKQQFSKLPGKPTPLYDTTQEQKLVLRQGRFAGGMTEQKQQFFPFQI